MTKLLVIRFSALGDVALLVPVVRAVAEQHPDVDITMLSQQRMADLFADMPANVVFHGVDLKKQSLLNIIRSLGSFNMVADMHNVLRSIYIRTIMTIKGSKVASIDKGRIEKRQLVSGRKHQQLKHTSQRYIDVFNKLGLPIELSSDQIQTKLKSCSNIGIAPFAAHQGKIYPIQKMEKVVEILSKRGEKVILFGGGEKEKEILASWIAKYPNVESVADKYSLKEELELMSNLRVMVTMDSANMHLASLVGTRVVSIWGATHPYAGFLGIGQSLNDCIQRDLPCRPCSIYGKKKCKFGDYRCMDIAQEEIVNRIAE